MPYGSVIEMASVLVGTEGSPNAASALKWALDYARMSHVTVQVLHVWHYPYATSEAGARADVLVIGAKGQIPTVVVPHAGSGED